MAARLYPRSVEEVFKDFKGRRAALIKALTTDVEEFYQQCDPGSFDISPSIFSATHPLFHVSCIFYCFRFIFGFVETCRYFALMCYCVLRNFRNCLCVERVVSFQYSSLRLKVIICIWKFLCHQGYSRRFKFAFGALQKERENLCLYGHPHGEWEVNLPVEEVPPELPEPALGINFARDGMQEKDWLALIAVHSDSWLLAVSFYFGARFSIDKADRKRLFGMINELPTVFEVVTGAAKKQQKEKEKSPVSNSSSKSKSNSKLKTPEPQGKVSKPQPKDEEEELDEEEDDEHGETLCGACGDNYASDEFWICCDICEKWFHGKCVKITPAKAEQIKQYKCPSCSNKRPRP